MMIFSVLAGLFFAESATRPARTIELASDPMHPVAVSGLDNDEKAGVRSRPNGPAAQAVGLDRSVDRTTHRGRTILSRSKGLGHMGPDPHALRPARSVKAAIDPDPPRPQR